MVLVGEMVGCDQEMCAPAVNGKSKSQIPARTSKSMYNKDSVSYYEPARHRVQSTAHSMFAEQQKNVKINKQISKQIFNL